jgi:hypothetical protein
LRRVRDRVLRDHEGISPATLVHRRVRVQDESEDLVADLVPRHPGADLLDDSREVAPQGYGKLILGHALEHPGGDRGVRRVDRRRMNADEDLTCARARNRKVVAKSRRALEPIQRECANPSLLSSDEPLLDQGLEVHQRLSSQRRIRRLKVARRG